METGLGGRARFQQLVVRRGKSISGSPRPSLWSPSPGASPLPPSPAHPPAHVFLLRLLGRSSAPAALLGLACLLSLCAGASRSFKTSHVVSLTCWHQRQLCVYRFQRQPARSTSERPHLGALPLSWRSYKCGWGASGSPDRQERARSHCRAPGGSGSSPGSPLPICTGAASGAPVLPLLWADGTCWDGSSRGHQHWLRACRSRPSVCPPARMEMPILGTLPETCLFGRFRS